MTRGPFLQSTYASKKTTNGSKIVNPKLSESLDTAHESNLNAELEADFSFRELSMIYNMIDVCTEVQ